MVRDEALRKALRDQDPSVRVVAAMGCGAVEVLADVVGSTRVSPRTRVNALEGLVELDAATPDLLLPLLSQQPPLVLGAAARVAGEIGATACRRAVHAAISSTDPGVAAAACTALGLLGAAEDEQALRDVAVHGDLSARIAATAALGRVGTLVSVPSLEPFSRGLMTDGDLKRAARAAIAAIQARGVGTRPGGLSVVEDAGGRLSREEPGAGALSTPVRLRLEDG